MNRKGFTMIELLMVIVIIAILSAILIPNIIVIMNKNNEKNIEALEKNIISAAKTYVNDNKYDMGFSCTHHQEDITLKELKDKGYISNIINPNTHEEYDLERNYVEIQFDCDNKTFEYIFELR